MEVDQAASDRVRSYVLRGPQATPEREEFQAPLRWLEAGPRLGTPVLVMGEGVPQLGGAILSKAEGERLGAYFPEAAALMGVTLGGAAQQAHEALLILRLNALPQLHMQLSAREDGRLPPAEILAEIELAVERARALRDSLVNSSKGLRQFVAARLFRTLGRPAISPEQLAADPPPIFKPLAEDLACLEQLLLEEAAAFRSAVSQGKRRVGESPDSILISQSLDLAAGYGRSKEDGLRLARLAYFVSTGSTPSPDWGRRQVKARKVRTSKNQARSVPGGSEQSS